MSKFWSVLLAASVVLAMNGVASAQKAQKIQRITAEQAQAAAAQQPAEPTPTAEEIKAGAAKIKKAISWEKIPSDLFGKYEGTWAGNYWAYSLDGQLQQTSQAKVKFTIQSDGSMKMESYYFDMLSKSYFTGEIATYKNNGNSIDVTIERGKGKVDRQVGHWNDNQLFLTSNIKDGVEHFRERIDGKRMLVDGFGVYGSMKGDDKHVFIGRYLREK